jgi:NAD+ synthetase
MKTALAQINTIVGDIAGNTRRILDGITRAVADRADIIVFPELAVFGYPPKDLVYRKSLINRNVEAVNRIAQACTNITALVGFIHPDSSGEGRGIQNAAALCRHGRVEGVYAKMLLPTYDVFDEARYFDPGRAPFVFEHETGGVKKRIGVTICEDLWNNTQFEGRAFYGVDPVKLATANGTSLLINLSASPYRADVNEEREELFATQVRALRVPLVYVNQVGGHDDLLFDGASLAMDAGGKVVARAKAFAEDYLLVDLPEGTGRCEPYPSRIESIRQALLLGVRDYLNKCGFGSAIVGLSGGIDSALTAVIAADALGPNQVYGVALPSRYSSTHSLEDAATLAKNLGIHYDVISIESVHRAFEDALAPAFEKAAQVGSSSSNASAASPGVSPPVSPAEENLQARIRGNILMALSNKFGRLVLATGNKSEWAVGYCTLYGDMCGGLAPLSDVPKTVVYELARHINALAGFDRIPERTLTKAPSAELREKQTDQDTLPPYDVLDAILEAYVEQEASIDDLAGKGFDRATVERVARMVDLSEYKRKQAPVGLKVTSRAFGTGRRMPIAARFW